MMEKIGKFVTFEGCEGVGKTWQIRKLCRYLEKNNVDFVVTREPGGSAIAEKIRHIILDTANAGMGDVCEALLYSAARAQHLQDIIKPALSQGKLVICDRYIDSTYAYQGVARGLGAQFIDSLNSLAVGEYIPDLTLFLDLPPELAFARKGGADSGDRLETMDLQFHKQVYEGYLSLKQLPRFVSIDASGDKDNTHRLIVEALKNQSFI